MIDHIVVKVQKLYLNSTVLICLGWHTINVFGINKGGWYSSLTKNTFRNVCSKMRTYDCDIFSTCKIRCIVQYWDHCWFIKISKFNQFRWIIDQVVWNWKSKFSWIIERNVLCIWNLKQNCIRINEEKILWFHNCEISSDEIKFYRWSIIIHDVDSF